MEKRRICLIIEYDGRNYNGWQKQKDYKTIEEEIETAIFTLTKNETKIYASGRTDRGVSALKQVAHFDSDFNLPPTKYAKAINTYLPDDIRIKDSFEVEKDFHARYSPKSKTYIYSMYIAEMNSPLLNRTRVFIKAPIDVKKMQDAVNDLIGEHDFKCFYASGGSVKKTIREIYSASLTSRDNLLDFEITGNGFLYNMVRIIVGTLVDIGYGKLGGDAIKIALETGERKNCGKTMTAYGLCLKDVKY